MKKIFFSFCLFASLIAGAQNNVKVVSVIGEQSLPQPTKPTSHNVEPAKDTTTSECPDPLPAKIKALCDCIYIREKPSDEEKGFMDYAFERRLADMACTNYTKKNREEFEEFAAELRLMWEKHKTKFVCTSASFESNRANILKYAVLQGFKPFLETIVGLYGFDINFIDPADNINLWDYVNDEVEGAITRLGANHPKVKLLKEYQMTIEVLGGKPSKPAK